MFNITQYVGELGVDALKRAILDTSVFFNTNDLAPKAIQSQFSILDDMEVLEGDEVKTPVAGTCNGVAVSCASASDFKVLADYPIAVNTALPQCSADDAQNQAKIALKKLLRKWTLAEIRKGFTIGTGATGWSQVDISSATDVVEQLKLVIKNQVINDKNDYDVSSYILAVSPEVSFELAARKINAVTIEMLMADPTLVVKNPFGVQVVVEVPKASCPANFHSAFYVKDLAMIKAFCEVAPYTALSQADTTIGDQYLIKGKELIGVGIYDAKNSGSFALTTPITEASLTL